MSCIDKLHCFAKLICCFPQFARNASVCIPGFLTQVFQMGTASDNGLRSSFVEEDCKQVPGGCIRQSMLNGAHEVNVLPLYTVCASTSPVITRAS